MKINSIKRGVTLLELIIVIGILSIVLTSIFSFNLFGIKTYARSESQWNLQSDTRSICDLVTSQLRYASEVEITDQTPTKNDGYNYIRTEGKSIKYYKNGFLASTFPAVSAGNIEYRVDFAGSTDNMVSFIITAYDNIKKTNYAVESNVMCLNLNSENKIKLSGSFGSLKYK